LDYSLELTRKKVGNSPSFPSVNYSAPSDKRFRSSRILNIDLAAEFGFWTEHLLNGTELLGLGLTETLDVPNTIMVENPLSFPMVHNTAVGSSTGLVETEIWADHTFQHKSGFSQNFAMTSPETLNMKLDVNELSSAGYSYDWF
jgi:hypothetical protein